MKNQLQKLAGILLCAMLLQACSKDSEDKLTDRCSTENMKYSANVLPVLTSACYGCHDNNTITAGISLEGYANLKVQVDNGKFLGAITHSAGFTPMPYDGPKLSDCDISKITAWIQAGALNN